ncbi:MAG: aminoglycoside 3-N-acetyltransferase [Actinomycetota bacterium]|jgi:aminoglycoside 3-N-acetyltransferase
MSERELIERTSRPGTVEAISQDLRNLGVKAGDVLVVHTSLSSLGWVAGGGAAVVDALLATVTPSGTVSMPAHSGDWSDPSGWANPPVPSSWWREIVEGRPAFDPYATPLREMGAVAENLLMRRETLRSSHPLHSHMANGLHAEQIVADHSLDDSFGDRSPLGRLYDLGAKVLLLGVGHGQNTSLHLAESRAQWPGKKQVEFKSRVMTSDGPKTTVWMGDDVDADDFEALGQHLEQTCEVRIAGVGQAESRLADMRTLVDAAVEWFSKNRT